VRAPALARVGGAIQRLFQAAKMNDLTLGNALPHLHTHLLARFLDDDAPRRPIPWDPISSAPELPEVELLDQVSGLRRLVGDRRR
jgi:diadenosine tetraphosphate (Ap4A) HIT family hydrolase